MNVKWMAFLGLIIVCLMSIYCQDEVQADKEVLGKITIGPNIDDVNYKKTEEGIFGPICPFIDENGSIFFIDTLNGKDLEIYKNGKFEKKRFVDNFPNRNAVSLNLNFSILSQKGYLVNYGIFSVGNSGMEFIDFRRYIGVEKYISLGVSAIYPTKWGIFIDFYKTGQCFSMEKLGTGAYKLRSPDETRKWLINKNSDYIIGDDGAVYYKNIHFSVLKNIDGKMYRGKLASSHNMFMIDNGYNNYFSIENQKGENELTLSIPWVQDNSDTKLYTYGIGNWGEIYCLILPKFAEKEGSSIDYPEIGSFAELVVIRNHLKYFGVCNADNVRIRKEPNQNAQVLGTIPLKVGFRIFEHNGKTETINGKTSDWVKIRYLDGTEGWIFGAYVQNLYDGPNGTPPPWPNVADW